MKGKIPLILVSMAVFTIIILISVSLYAQPESGLGSRKKQAQFSFNVFGWTILNPAQKEKTISALKQLKVDLVRVPFPWAFIEPQRGNFDFTKQDEIINVFSKNGINLLLMVTGSPRWAVRNYINSQAIPPDDVNDYARFMAKSAGRYKNRGLAWEIWNEPDNRPYWGRKKSTPQEYMNLLKPAFKAIKKEDPSAIVVGGCVLVQFMNKPDYSYLEGLLKSGLLDYCDVVSVHIYPEESADAVNQFNKCMNAVEQLVSKHGSKKIWVTEVGLLSKRFSEEKLKQLLKARGLSDGQIRAMLRSRLCRYALTPARLPEMNQVKLRNKGNIEKALSPFGLTFKDANELSLESLVDVQEEQADLTESLYSLSIKHRMFWFQLYDLMMSAGMVDKDFYPKSAYKRILNLIEN